jgi:hypothetical protein
MHKKYLLGGLFTLFACAATAQVTPEAVVPVIEATFAAHDCALPLATGQAVIAENVASELGVSVEELTQQGTAPYAAMGAAMGGLMTGGVSP